MEKIEQKSLNLEIAEQNGEIIYKDGKTLCKFEFLRLWEKNPRIIDDKNLNKLQNQIQEIVSLRSSSANLFTSSKEKFLMSEGLFTWSNNEFLTISKKFLLYKSNAPTITFPINNTASAATVIGVIAALPPPLS